MGAFVACRASRKSSSGKLRSFSSDSTVISRNLPAHTSFATRDLPLSASSGKGRMRLSRLRPAEAGWEGPQAARSRKTPILQVVGRFRAKLTPKP